MRDQTRDELAKLLGEAAVYTAEHGCEFYIGPAELADVILASGLLAQMLREARAEAFDQGYEARSYASEGIVVPRKWVENPYRDSEAQQ